MRPSVLCYSLGCVELLKPGNCMYWYINTTLSEVTHLVRCVDLKCLPLIQSYGAW